VPGLIPTDRSSSTSRAALSGDGVAAQPEEFDYIVEADVFHDFFGHVPLLYDPVYAEHLSEYGRAA